MSDVHSRGPNILITGTPGTGKTTLSREIAEATGLSLVNIGELAKENNFYCEYDATLQCYELDEDKVIDEIDEQMKEGGNIVDYHGCDFFPERWFDIVFVLRTDNTSLFERLEKRSYSAHKIQENIQAEIFQTILDEAKDSYKPEIVFELQSNTPDDMDRNLEQIKTYVKQWKLENNVA
jgi:adenylate kinase